MKFKATPTFFKALKRLRKKYRTLNEDIESLCSTLRKNPMAGTPLGAGLYKIRLASSDIAKGKSAAFRVIYYLMLTADTIVLLDLYAKSTIENVPVSELRKVLESYLRANGK